MPADDPHDLQRFVEAQREVYPAALTELRRGQKRSHWMWFIFPQVAGLGHSATAQRYAIRSREEAVAYLRHEVLGPRLQECAAALLRHRQRRIGDIMGYPDDLKLRSSMTLFAAVAGDDSVFHQVLAAFCQGEPDPHTLRFLGSG